MTTAQAKARRARAERQIVAAVKRHDAKVAAKSTYYQGVMRLAMKAAKNCQGWDAAGVKLFKAQAAAARKRLNYWLNVKPPVVYSGRAVALVMA